MSELAIHRVVVVHATSLLRRAYATATPGRTHQDGTATHALYVLVRAIRHACAFKKTSHMVAVVAESLRGTDDAGFCDQHDKMGALLDALGIAWVKGHADADVVASFGAAAEAAGGDVVLVGGDKRLAQCVSASSWWYDPFKNARYTPEMVKKRFLVPPDKAGQWLALVGDDDTLPGVKGIGKKGAADAILQYDSVLGALDAAAEVKGRLGNVLRAEPEAIRHSLEAAALDSASPLPLQLSGCVAPSTPDDALQPLFRAYGFLEFLQQGADEAAAPKRVLGPGPDLDAALDALRGQAVVMDTLSAGPSPVRGHLVGLALLALPAKPSNPAFYIPLGDGAKNRLNTSPAALPTALVSWLEDASAKKVGHNIKASQVALEKRGVTLRGIVADTEHQSHLREPSRLAPHDLDGLATRVLRRPLPDTDAVLGVGRRRKDWDAIDDDHAAGYLLARVDRIAALYAHGGAPLPTALTEEYAALADTLVGMERRGMACDADDLRRSGEDFDRIGAELQRDIHELAGETFLLTSTKQLGHILFEKLGLPIYRRTKTGWSTANEALERIADAHPIVPKVLRYKRLRRLKDSWVTALIRAIDDDGRVRSTFHPARSFSGRLVNAQPDLGRVPGRTAEMKRIRRAFAAPPGHHIMSVDYTQLGLYVLAHLTGDPALTEPLREQADMHTLTASAVLSIPVADVDRDKRQLGKVVNFATFASQGASALAQQLGLSPDEAKGIIERFFAHYAVTAAFFDEQLRLAQSQGYIVTLARRRWPIGNLDSPDIHLRSYAERLAKRATHEASVADVSRRALLRADNALRAAGLQARPIHSILDEVILEVPDDERDEAADVVSKAMQSAFDLRVPLRVGVKVGANWADLQPLP